MNAVTRGRVDDCSPCWRVALCLKGRGRRSFRVSKGRKRGLR